MALDSMRYDALGDVKLIPKNPTPEDRWCYEWVHVSASSEFRHSARVCTGRAVVAVGEGC